jgi:N-acetylmuramoyl-L-alanine amidase
MRAQFFLLIALVLSLTSLEAASAAIVPDRQLYLSAKKDYELLAKNKITPQNRLQWERAAERFERLPQEFPKSRYCDAAYYYAGRIYQETSASSKDARTVDRSIRNYRLLVAKYPNSAYAAEGRYRLALALEEGRGDRNEARQQYALVAAKYAASDWGRKSRSRLAVLDAQLQQDKRDPVPATVMPSSNPVPEPWPKPAVLKEKLGEPAPLKPGKPASPAPIRKIVIDAGHGGRDPGAIGVDGVAEKDIVLAVALRLADKLKKEMGIDAVLTRKDDTFVPLEERTAIANQQGADLFISLHANASPNPEARGLETYYLDNTNDEAALRLAARENGIAREKISDLQFILSDMVQNLKLEDSITLAHRLQGSVVTQMGRRYGEVRDLGVKKAQFFVLVGARMPSVLVELFFVTNKAEGRALTSEEYQEALADALYDGIKKYQESALVVKNL